MSDYTETTLYRCRECGETSDSYEEARLYECPECSLTFSSNSGGGKIGNLCPDCGNKFGSRIDAGDKYPGQICDQCEAGEVDAERSYICDECGQEFDDEHACLLHCDTHEDVDAEDPEEVDA